MLDKKAIISMILVLLSVSSINAVTVSCGHSLGLGNYEFTNYDVGDVEVAINNGFSSIQILPENPFTLAPGESKIISLRSQYSDTYINFFVMYKELYGSGFSASLECHFYATKTEHPVETTTSTTTTTIPEGCLRCVQWFRGTCVAWENICDDTTTTQSSTTTTQPAETTTTISSSTTTTLCQPRCVQWFRGMCISWNSCDTTTTIPQTTTTQQPVTTTTIQGTTTTQPSTCQPTCRQWFRGVCISWNSCDTTTTIPQTTTTQQPVTTTTIQGTTTTTICQPRCVQWFRVDCIKWEFC